MLELLLQSGKSVHVVGELNSIKSRGERPEEVAHVVDREEQAL